MTTNLLRNPSFEDGHKDDGNCQIPNDWEFYAYESETNPHDPAPFVRPEVRVMPRHLLPEHERDLFILDGDHTLKVFKDSGAWFAHLIQPVALDKGTYCFGIKLFGDLVKDYEDGQKIWGDDPEGRDGLMRFSLDGHVYDWYSITPGEWNDFSLTFSADGYTYVGIEIMCPFPLDNSGIFADDWALIRTDEPDPPKECRGHPRVQYPRTYHVIPDDATLKRGLTIFERTWGATRATVGSSYDDAGVGDLDDRLAVLWDVPEAERAKKRRWYRKHYPGVTVRFRGRGAEPERPAEALGELLTLHLQAEVDGWREYVQNVKPAWVKVFQFELAPIVKALSPETRVLVRHHFDSYGEWVYATPKAAAARDYLSRFWDSLIAHAESVDAIEGVNETIATGNLDTINNTVAFSVALSDELASRDIGVAACLMNVAVGNPQHGAETALMLPAAEAAVRNGHYLGYHPYFPCHPEYAEEWMQSEWKHYHGRALESWDSEFSLHDVKPRYLFTEGGAVGASLREDGAPGWLNPNAGWRSSACLNGDFDRYTRLLIEFDGIVFAWNQNHNNRAEMCALFTSAPKWMNWEDYRLTKPELEALETALTE